MLYVMDVVRFCTNERFLQWFLLFDADSFLNVINLLFKGEPAVMLQNQSEFIAH